MEVLGFVRLSATRGAQSVCGGAVKLCAHVSTKGVDGEARRGVAETATAFTSRGVFRAG